MDYAFSLPTSPHQPGTYMGGGAAFAWLVKDPASFSDYCRSLQDTWKREAILDSLRAGLGDKNLPMRKREPAMEVLERLKLGWRD